MDDLIKTLKIEISNLQDEIYKIKQLLMDDNRGIGLRQNNHKRFQPTVTQVERILSENLSKREVLIRKKNDPSLNWSKQDKIDLIEVKKRILHLKDVIANYSV